MLNVYWDEDFTSSENVFLSTDQYFDDCITADALQQPIYKLLIESIDHCTVNSKGIVTHLNNVYTTTVDRLSTGVKQLILVLFTADMEGVPAFLGSRFGDNCWDWVYLFSHLNSFSQRPLSICLDCITLTFDHTVKIKCTDPKGLIMETPYQVQRYAHISSAEEEMLQKDLSVDPVRNRPRNPPYFDSFRHLCKEPDQVCSMDDLNRIAEQVLAKETENSREPNLHRFVNM